MSPDASVEPDVPPEELPDDQIREHLITELRQLAKLRGELARAQEAWQKRLDALRETNADLLEAIDQIEGDVDQQDDHVRELARYAYEATGDKHPAPGVTVAEKTTIEYDEDRAYEWASEKDLFIQPQQLDRKAFEKFARENPEQVDFVVLGTEPQPRISRSLDEDLDQDAGEDA